MKRVVCAMIGIVCLVAAGCQTTTPTADPSTQVAEPTPGSPAIARTAQAVIAASADLKIQIFDHTGKEVPELPKLPKGKTGSVSIHAADGTGQDNYTFDQSHRITKHMRSYGDDYSAGKWEEVK